MSFFVQLKRCNILQVDITYVTFVLLMFLGAEIGSAQVEEAVFTFTVDVPANTPLEDKVYLQSGWVKVWPMERVDEDTWTLTLREIDVDPTNPAYGADETYIGPWIDVDITGTKTIGYVFTRGWNYQGTEALVEEGPQNQWAIARNEVLEAGKAYHDVVERWRWLPADNTPSPVYDPVLTAWERRINDTEFQGGVFLLDIYRDELRPMMGPTNKIAKHDANATWVEIAPPWDYLQIHPVPILHAQNEVLPAYRTKDDLRTHIREMKSLGLKVLMEPQICCNGPPQQEFSEAWYKAWFDQYEVFLLYHARIAADEGVESMLFDLVAITVGALPGSEDALPWFEERWRELVSNVRAIYSGPIGYAVSLGGTVGEYRPPGPYEELRPILDLFDYIGVAVWSGVAVSNDDTQDQITENVERLFENTLQPIFDETGRPVILYSVAFGSYDGAAKNEFGVGPVGDHVWYPEQDSQFVNDPIEQAMVFQAIMRAVAERPYIVGVYPFSYSYLAFPNAPDYSVRAKPAEKVLAAWYELAKTEVPLKVEPGHSGAFYNPARNGEGNYVEVLNSESAVVYTFTYRQDGSGPAWFVGVGDITGDSIVVEDLLRPIGTSFGDGFNTTDIDFTPAGSMTMSFPDCKSAGDGGSVVYSGSHALGYESLRSRTVRLGQITGCGEPETVNSGLSGSFYNAARNGEGIVVEWLTNGQVVIVFFTYDLEGNQFWAVGVAPPNGKSVTMEVLYPSSGSRWGSQFNPDEVELGNWGTFTLNWVNCNEVTFEYDSVLPGFGSAVRNYTRISTLAGTNCPTFP
jgi:hypothetical protein